MFVILLSAILLLSPSVPCAETLQDRLASIPDPRMSGRWVYDGAGVVPAGIARMNSLIGDFEKRTTVEIVVVILPTNGEFDSKEFATALFNRWKVGKKGKDNGILVLHVLDKRRIEIEAGYGMEEVLTDGKCGMREIDSSPATGESGEQAPPGSGEEYSRNLSPPPQRRLLLRGAPVRFEQILAGLTVMIGLFVSLSMLLVFRSNWKGKTIQERYRIYKEEGPPYHYGSALLMTGGIAYLVARQLRFTDTGLGIGALMVSAALGMTWLWRKVVLKRLRSAPRRCERCDAWMERLDEASDDSYLLPGNVAEESVGAIDYDVWKCSCGHCRIESYDRKCKIRNCPQCRFKTLTLLSSSTIAEPTETGTGVARDEFRCAYCKHVFSEERTLPKIPGGGSYGTGSGFYSGGGSFGGGSSGGGGAGRNY